MNAFSPKGETQDMEFAPKGETQDMEFAPTREQERKLRIENDRVEAQ